MTQPNPISEKPGVTLLCPKCANPMWLVRLERRDADHDLRTFECKVCDHSESQVVKFR